MRCRPKASVLCALALVGASSTAYAQPAAAPPAAAQPSEPAEPDSAAPPPAAAAPAAAPGSGATAGEAQPGAGGAAATPEEIEPPASASATTVKPALETQIRGFGLGLDLAAGFMPLELDGVKYLPGGGVAFAAAYDISELMRIEGTFFYTGFGSRANGQQRDVVLAGAQLLLRFTVYQDGPVWLNVGAGGGYLVLDDALTVPYRQSGFGAIAGGVEYYTDLRHFSLGVDLGFQFLIKPFNVNMQVVPHVRYTF